MNLLTIRILQLTELLNSYMFDELEPRDIDKMNEIFEKLINEIRELKDDIVIDRAMDYIKKLKKEDKK